jgi:1-acyl-sn-glycerol-3-phosphate acyltransferase
MGRTYRICASISSVIARTVFWFRAYGTENIPMEGGCLIAMNHESYLDPPLAGISAPRELFFLARKSLLKWPVIGRILPSLNVIPVDQERADMSALKTLIKQIRSGHGTVIFPEGSRSPDGTLQPAQPGAGLVIAKTRCPVIPARIFGAHEAFPRGGTPRLFRPIRIVFEPPMHFAEGDFEGDGRDLYQRLSNRVMERIAEIQSPENRSRSHK